MRCEHDVKSLRNRVATHTQTHRRSGVELRASVSQSALFRFGNGITLSCETIVRLGLSRPQLGVHFPAIGLVQIGFTLVIHLIRLVAESHCIDSGVVGGSTRIEGLGPSGSGSAALILSSGRARALSDDGTFATGMGRGGGIRPRSSPPNGVTGTPAPSTAGVGGSVAASSGDLGCTAVGSGSISGRRCFGIVTNFVQMTPLP